MSSEARHPKDETAPIPDLNNARTSFARYDNDMYMRDTIQTGRIKDENSNNFGRFEQNYSTNKLIPADWEKKHLNDNENYLKSPSARHQGVLGNLSPDKHLTRTFNRKMKMRDTFTSIFPSYSHTDRTVFTTIQSHITHKYPTKQQEDPNKPMHEMDRRYTHKVDVIKNYSEEMYKLGTFAPQPIKGK